MFKRRKLTAAALSILGLVLVLLVSVYVYIRSGRLDRFLRGEIVNALADVGITADINSAHLDIRPYRVTIEGLTLYPTGSSDPIAKVDSIRAGFSVLDYLSQKIRITDVTVEHPHVWIRSDKTGKSNLDALHAPPSGGSKADNSDVDFEHAFYGIENADLSFLDAEHDLRAEISGASAYLAPRDNNGKGALDSFLRAVFDKAEISYRGSSIRDVSFRLEAAVTEQSAEVSQLTIGSDAGGFSATGKVGGFEPFKYDFDVSSGSADLAHIIPLLDREIPLEGMARFDGTVTGAGDEYRAKLELSSNSLTASDFRINGVRIKTDVEGAGQRFTATASSDLSEASNPAVSVKALQSTARIRGKEDGVGVSGPVSLGSITGGGVTVDSVKGQVELTPQRITLSDLNAQVLGGTVRGSASVAYHGGPSKAELAFDSINLGRSMELVSLKDLQLAGSATGTVALDFPGLNYKAATGQADATFAAQVSRSGSSDSGSSQATGEVHLTADGRGLKLQKALIHSSATDLEASGELDWDGQARLDVKLKSEDMAEVQRSADSLGFIPDEAKEQYEFAVSGATTFEGRLEGKLDDPTVTGRLDVSGITMHGEELGAFTGDVSYSQLLVKADGSLVRPDGSRADFSLVAPLQEENQVAVKASFSNFDIPSLLKAAVPGLSDMVGRGLISGDMELTGLPGPRSIQGTGTVTVSAAEFNVPSTEGEDQARKVLVPHFSGKASFENSKLIIPEFQAEVDQGSISGRFNFDFDNYSYSVKTTAKNVDLGRMSFAISDSLQLSGVADLTVDGQGNWDDWSTNDLNASVQGHDVTIGGRQLGNARLEVTTRDGTLRVEASGNVLDQPRSFVATVNLRDPEKNYPINGEIEFTDADIEPYLSLLTTQLPAISGRATGKITLGGPLKDPDKIQAVARITKFQIGGTVAEGRQYVVTNQGDIVLTADTKGITISPVTFAGEGTRVTIGGVLYRQSDDPVVAADQSLINITGELNLGLLSSFTPVIYTTGVARLEASIVGSLSTPKVLGSADLANVGIRVVNFPIALARGNGRIRFTSNQAAIENFSGITPGGGALTLSGGAALSGLVPELWRVEMGASQVSVEYPRDTQTTFGGTMVLQGNPRFQILSGDLKVTRAAYTKELSISELIRTKGGPFSPEFVEAGPGGGGEPGPKVNLDVHIDADETLLVRNNLADAVGSAHINLRGPISEPLASGRVMLTRGTMEFRGERYDLERALITFPGTKGAPPIVDVQADADLTGYHVTIAFSGAPDTLRTTLRSDPELPENDLLALVLTGRTAGDLIATGASNQTGLGLAQTLLSTTLSEQLTRQSQRIFGLSRLSIDPLIVGRGIDPNARVTVGQKITKDLTVTYSQNLTQGPTGLDRIVLVEYRLSNRLSIVGTRDDERGSIGFDVRLRKRF